MIPEQWTWLLCSVNVIPEKKLSLQELTQLIRIKLLTSGFLEMFASLFQFPGAGANARLASPADAHEYIEMRSMDGSLHGYV